jgi:hypothetical protein
MSMPDTQPSASTNEMNWGTPPAPPKQGGRTPGFLMSNRAFFFVMALMVVTSILLSGFAVIPHLLLFSTAMVAYASLPFESIGCVFGARRAGAGVRYVQIAFWTLQFVDDNWHLHWAPRWFGLHMVGHAMPRQVTEHRIQRTLEQMYLGRIYGAFARAGFVSILALIVPALLGYHVLLYFTVPLLIVMLILAVAQMSGVVAMRRALRAGDATTERVLAIEMVGIASANGVRPRDWDPRWCAAMLTPNDDSRWEAIGFLNAHLAALDGGHVEGARLLLGHAMRLVEERHQFFLPMYGPWAGFFAAWYDGDADAARRWSGNIERAHITQHTRSRLRAAMLLAEGRPAEACEEARIGLAALSPSLDPGNAPMDADFLHAIIERAEAALQRPPAAQPTFAAW